MTHLLRTTVNTLKISVGILISANNFKIKPIKVNFAAKLAMPGGNQRNKIMRNYLIIIIAVLLQTNTSYSQEQVIDNSFNTWWTNVNKYHLTKKWFLSSELHVRLTDGVSTKQQFLFRPAVNYTVNPNVVLSAGYTYILSYPYGEQPLPTTIPENNVWEEVLLKSSAGKFKFSHRYRFEQRFIGNAVLMADSTYEIQGSNFEQRFRYRLTGSRQIVSSGKIFAKFFDEIWLNQADNFMPAGLNQNWLYGGLGYRFSDIGNVQLGFMHQLLKKGDGIHYESNPTIQFSIGFEFGKKATSGK